MSSKESGRGSNTWMLVLAAGQGTRLSSLTTDANGLTVPKQFCSLNGGPSLLHMAIGRARTVVPSERICVVVAEEQRRWWRKSLAMLPPSNVLVQPRNRGTGMGILLALLCIMARDPEARIAFLPSDHYLSDEEVLARALESAIGSLGRGSTEMILLGITPEEADPELGYVIPASSEGTAPARVRQFVEKPPAPIAARLIEVGGLWNSFIFTANAIGLLQLFQRRHAETVTQMRAALDCPTVPQEVSSALRHLYRDLPTVDFSRHILESAAEWLRVSAVQRCGWSDLGTVPRVKRVVRELPEVQARANGRNACFDLACAVRGNASAVPQPGDLAAARQLRR